MLKARPNPRQGMKLFQICAECHGPHGAGEASGWPPEIAGQHPRVIAKELTDFRSGLRWYDPMERIAVRHVLHTTQDVADVAAYVGSLPPSTDTTPGAGKYLERRGRMYATVVSGQASSTNICCGNSKIPSGVADRTCARNMEELVGLAGYMSRLGSSAGQPLQTGRHKDGQDAGNEVGTNAYRQ